MPLQRELFRGADVFRLAAVSLPWTTVSERFPCSGGHDAGARSMLAGARLVGEECETSLFRQRSERKGIHFRMVEPVLRRAALNAFGMG